MKNKKKNNFYLLSHNAAIFLLLSILTACSGSSGGSAEYMNIDISGTISYEDKQYGRYGFNGNTDFKAVRFAVVELVDANDDIVVTTKTDESGYYELSGSGHDLRVRVLAQLDASVGTTVSVNDHSGNLYSATHHIDLEELGEDGVVDIAIDVVANIVGAFNMLDVYASATQFVRELSNAPMPELNVYWQNKSNSYGTYYCFTSRVSRSCPQGKGIYILGGRSSGGGDTDHFDDDVLLHEYAHYIEGMVGAQDSPGGTHYLTENDQDLRLTWSEGLGAFFPAAVKTWLTENNPDLLSTASGLASTYFIDTYGTYVGISIDVDNPTAYYCYGANNDCFSYSSSEIAVAKVLIGVMKEFGTQAIWDVYSSYMARGTSLPATLETFWDGWIAQRAPSSDELENLKAVFNERLVYYEEDGFEMDNEIGLYSSKLDSCPDDNCDGETHHLYHQDLHSDKDHVAFDARPGRTYLIETMNLSNAADTYLRILDADGNVVVDSTGTLMVNDNRPGTVFCGPYDNPCRIRNDDLTLSSELTFKPSRGGTYFAEVTASPYRPASSGRYGTYTLQISH